MEVVTQRLRVFNHSFSVWSYSCEAVTEWILGWFSTGNLKNLHRHQKIKIKIRFIVMYREIHKISPPHSTHPGWHLLNTHMHKHRVTHWCGGQPITAPGEHADTVPCSVSSPIECREWESNRQPSGYWTTHSNHRVMADLTTFVHFVQLSCSSFMTWQKCEHVNMKMWKPSTAHFCDNLTKYFVASKHNHGH